MADLTRRQIAMMADEFGIADYPAAVRLVRRAFDVSRSARAALAADGPAVPEGREPASVVDQPSDEEIIQEAIKADLVYRPIDDESHVFSGFVESHALNTYVLSFARAVLARWGRHDPPAAGAPCPPMEDVGPLIAWLTEQACQAADASQPTDAGMLTWAAQVIGERVDETDEEWYALVDRLWDKYQTVGPQGERSVYEYAFFNACEEIASSGCHPAPVPVAERLPGPEDCAPWPKESDASAWCWMGKEVDGGWEWEQRSAGYLVAFPGDFTHWLPAHALPLPAGEVAHG